MKTKQKIQRKREINNHRHKNGKSQINGQPERESDHDDDVRSLLAAQHLIGNRAVERMVQNGRKSGEFSFRASPPGIMRQVLLEKAAAQAGLAPAVQRQDEEETFGEPEPMEAGPTATNDGVVTILDVIPETYDVTGRTLAEVGAQLDPDEWGRCRWNVGYSYETTGGKATKVDITLTLTIRMPRWAGPGYEAASPAARAEWQRMIAALQRHEDRHAEIAREWAPKFKENMLNQRESKLANKHATTLAKMEKEQKKFDTDTNHGQNAGVTLDVTIQ